MTRMLLAKNGVPFIVRERIGLLAHPKPKIRRVVTIRYRTLERQGRAHDLSPSSHTGIIRQIEPHRVCGGVHA